MRYINPIEDEQEQQIFANAMRTAENDKRDILQLLRDGQGDLLGEDQLDIVETWDVEHMAIDPAIVKAYDGWSFNTWEELVDLLDGEKNRTTLRVSAREAARLP